MLKTLRLSLRSKPVQQTRNLQAKVPIEASELIARLRGYNGRKTEMTTIQIPIVGRDDIASTMYEETEKRIQGGKHPVMYLATPTGYLINTVKQLMALGEAMNTKQSLFKDATHVNMSLDLEERASSDASYAQEKLIQASCGVDMAIDAFAKKLAFDYFCPHLDASWLDVFSRIKDLKVTLGAVLYAISIEAQTNIILISVDNYDYFHKKSPNLANTILQAMVEHISEVQAILYNRSRILVVTLLLGPFQDRFKEALRGAVPLTCRLLSPGESLTLVAELAKFQAFSSLRELSSTHPGAVNRVIKYFGGNSGAVLMWARLLAREPMFAAITITAREFSNSLALRNAVISRIIAEPLVILSFLKQEVSRDTILPGCTRTIAELAVEGYCSLQKISASNMVIVQLSGLHMQAYATSSKDLQLLSLLTLYQKTIAQPTTRNWELTHARLLSLKMQLLRRCAMKYPEEPWAKEVLRKASIDIVQFLFDIRKIRREGVPISSGDLADMGEITEMLTQELSVEEYMSQKPPQGVHLLRTKTKRSLIVNLPFNYLVERRNSNSHKTTILLGQGTTSRKIGKSSVRTWLADL